MSQTVPTTSSGDETIRSEAITSSSIAEFPSAVPVVPDADGTSKDVVSVVDPSVAATTATTTATTTTPATPATQEELQLRLKALMNRPDNQICCDCSDRKPTWASLIVPPSLPPSGGGGGGGAPNSTNTTTNAEVLGAFCCFNCSGAHRGLGTHISFVRSINLDTWKEKEVIAMERGGNKRVNAIFEAKWNEVKPTANADVTRRASYIRQKYIDKLWYEGDIYRTVSTIQDAEPVPKSPVTVSSSKKIKKQRMSQFQPQSQSQPQPQWSLHESKNSNTQMLSQQSSVSHGEPDDHHHWDPFAAMTDIPSPPKKFKPLTRASSSGSGGARGGRAKDELSMSWHPSAAAVVGVMDPIKTTSTHKKSKSFDDDDDFSVVSWKNNGTKSTMKREPKSSSLVHGQNKGLSPHRFREDVAFPEAAQESLGSFGHDHDADEADDLFASPKPRGNTGIWKATTNHYRSDSNLFVIKGLTANDDHGDDNDNNEQQQHKREELEIMDSNVEDNDEDDENNKSQIVSKKSSDTSSKGLQHTLVKSSSRVRTMKPTSSNSTSSGSASTSSTSRRMGLRKTLSVPAINTHKTEALMGRVRSTTGGGQQQQQQQRPHKGEEAHAPVTMKLDDNWNNVADTLFKTKACDEGGDYDGNDGSNLNLGQSSRHGKGGARRMLRRDRSDGNSDPLDTVSAHTSTSGSRSRKPDPPSTTSRRSRSSDAKRSTSGTHASSSGGKLLNESNISLPLAADVLSPSDETRDRSQSPGRTRTRSRSSSKDSRRTALSASAHNTRPRTSSKDALRKNRDPARRHCSNETENTASSTPSTTSAITRKHTPTRSSGTGLRRTRSNDMECLSLDNEKTVVTKKQTLDSSSSSALSAPSRSSGARLRRTRSNDLECLSPGKEELGTCKPTGGSGSGSTSNYPRSRSNDMVEDLNVDWDTWASGGKDVVTNRNPKTGEENEFTAPSSVQASSMSASGKALNEFEDPVASSTALALGTSVSASGKIRKGAATDPLGSRSEHHHNRRRSRSKSNGPRSRAPRQRSLDPTVRAKERRSRRNASGVDVADDAGGADPSAAPSVEHPSLKSSPPPHGVRTGNPRMSLSRAKSMSRLQRTPREQQGFALVVKTTKATTSTGTNKPTNGGDGSETESSASSFGGDTVDPLSSSKFADETTLSFADDPRRIRSIDATA